MQGFVNPGYTWEFEAGARATERAKKELELWEKTVYPGGLHVFINNQVRECYVSGASSAEWVPTPNRKSVSEVVVVSRETVFPVRDKETGRVVYEQRTLEGHVTLSPVTYRYQPLETEGESFHGLPVAISAPATLARKTGILTGVQKIINLMSRSALLTVLAPPPTPQDFGFSSQSDAGYLEAVSSYYSQVADLFESAHETGLYVGATGMEVKAAPLTQSAAGTTDIMGLNQKGVWSAASTLPLARGDTNASYALAKVQFPFLMAVADNIQKAIAAQVEWGANLHLRLLGIPATAFISWLPRNNPFALDDAQTEKTIAETDALRFKQFGRAYVRKAMMRADVVDDDYDAAPDWWSEPKGEVKTESKDKQENADVDTKN